MISSWWIQYRTFLWKIALQRLRSPGTTLAELLLPCLFTLLLALGFWQSTTTKVPTTDYSVKPPTNLSSLLPAFFCQNFSHPQRFGSSLPIGPCMPPNPNTVCFPFVRDGALCVRDRELMAKVMYGVYYAKGSVVVPTFDAYLALSAFATYEARRANPTFMSRTGQASLSHYGHLLLVGNGNHTAVATEFADYCSKMSTLCGEVVYKDKIFSSMQEAENFARENDGDVWAIAELPTPSTGVNKEGNIFTISMNYTATPWTFESRMSSFTKGLGGNEYMLYVTSGFLTLQNTIQLFYAQRRVNSTVATTTTTATTPSNASSVNPAEVFNYVNAYGPTLVPMPTPAYQDNDFYSSWAYFMPLVAMLAALFPVAKLVSWIVEEKSHRIRESMQIMGLRWSCMAFGWFTSAFFTDIVASILATLVLRFSFFSYVNYGVLFILYFSFMQQNSALSLFLSSFFTNPRVAGAVAALTIFVCCMPHYATPNGMSLVRLYSMCFLPCVAYAEAFRQLTTYASFGYSYSWANTREGDYSVSIAIGLMWASTALFLILWMYLDQVLPSSIGRRRHPLFFIQPLIKRLCCCRRRKEDVVSGEVEVNSSSETPVRGSPQQRAQLLDTSDERFPALFRNLRKVYETGGFIGFMYTFITGLRRDGDTCVAVNDVSFALERGRVNILLGPNGSGKSTLMGMATGMIKPTSGDVFICGHNALYELGKCHQEIGFCPQNDIVWNKLTVEQHLAFYARLKNGKTWNVQERVDKVITTLQLEEKRHTYAEDLSGGQRRRLCVGVSLIGNPKVLFLDEPTAGMDVRGRKAVYDALQVDRESRAVMISTHLLDEADRVGDRILLMQNGELCGAGSSLFLKSKMGVGYIVTCVVDTCESEMEENLYISRLTEFVRTKAYPGHYEGNPNELQTIPPGCKLLGIERRGREISFRFSLSLLSSAGSVIIRALEEEREMLHLHSIGLSLTTLQEVLDSIMDEGKEERKSKKSGAMQTSSKCPGAEQGISIQMDGNNIREPFLGTPIAGADGVCMENENDDNNDGNFGIELSEVDNDQHYSRQHSSSFFSHFAALFMKRVHYGKRDVRLLIFQVLLPVLFLGLALLIDLINPPKQPGIILDASLYPNYNKQPYSMIPWTTSSELPDVFGVETSDMSKAFGSYYTPVKVPCTVSNCSSPLSRSMMPDLMSHAATRNVAIALTSQLPNRNLTVPTSLLMHNVSSPHAAGQSLNVLYNVVNHQLFGEGVMMTAQNQPMAMGPTEEKMVGALRRVICGIFILLPFTFIPSNTVSFTVRENQSGSRHLQWLAGANVFAFWLSSMLFDFCCFLLTEALAMVIFVIFKRTEFIGNAQTVYATLALFSTFGLSSIPFSYVISFFFSSPFVAQNVVLIANFVLGFLWVMGEQIIGGVPSLENFMLYTTYILRVIPSVSFGEGMFILSGVELANLFVPDRERPNLFNLLTFENGKFKGGIGTGLIYMGGTFVVSLLVLVLLEYARVQRFRWFFSRIFCCCSRESQTTSLDDVETNDENNTNVEAMQLESVRRETAEVCQYASGRPGDAITLRRVSKRYGNGTFFTTTASADGDHHHNHNDNDNNDNDNNCAGGSRRRVTALSDVTLGVHRGEIMALLGLNGAGKSTAVGILAGTVVPTSGEAFINHHSVMRSASRRFVGYCPQRDALLDNLSPREHLTLYAALRGASPAYIRREIPRLLLALGLADKENRPAYALSGGNKRRLALALALVGGTTSVLLDEPTAGMDAVARRQMCAVVRRLTKNKSVILTTHLLDESEALADRVAFMSRGKLRCVGTPQELKTCFTDDAVYTVQVVFAAVDNAQEMDSNILSERLCKYFQTFDAAMGEAECTVESVVSRTVTLQVRRSLSSICSITTAIREGALEGLPPVVQISATQPTLEDILLRD
ncbi:ABC transporter [Trypanosoma theileri]|uniref:ABC transporter n=1 Tax=Trypanosoma theileri TaxID=67003 RepID=A0A1X0NZH7_9TRYP|nr:ABC transporter [Trypanosoma theileri]ORC90116.1 ABC transporter [Trypanosoma theileri]